MSADWSGNSRWPTVSSDCTATARSSVFTHSQQPLLRVAEKIFNFHARINTSASFECS